MLDGAEDLDEVCSLVLDEDVLGLAARVERERVVDLCQRRCVSESDCVELLRSSSFSYRRMTTAAVL